MASTSRPAKPRDILFVGHFRHPPNADGALWFAREVWPRVRDANWRARLVIAGAEPPDEITQLAHDPTVRVTGFMPDLAPLWRDCAAFVAPIRRGSGTRVKILEAMAAGAPVIATSVGIEGIGAVPGEHFLLADDPSAFADACLRLLAKAAERDRLAAAARRLVERRHDWDAIAAQLDEAWRRLSPKRIAVSRTVIPSGAAGKPESRNPLPDLMDGKGFIRSAPTPAGRSGRNGADRASDSVRNALLVQTCNPDLFAHVIRDARRRFPHARLTVLRQRGMAAHLSPDLPVDEWLDNPSAGRAAFARRLRRRGFDSACYVESGEPGFWKLKLLPWFGAPSAVFVYDRNAEATALNPATLAARLLGDWAAAPSLLTPRRIAAPAILWQCWRFYRRRISH
jgi:hypothetical protein